MKDSISIFVFIDAFGWEIYQRYGFLKNLLPYAKKLETTFGFSSAADPSILTGRYPDEHTHWSSFVYDPYNSPFKPLRLLSYLPPALVNNWTVRHNLSKVIKKLYRYTGYFEMYLVPFAYLPYFDYLEKKDYYVPGGIMQTDTIFDWCVKKEIPYFCSNWRHNEEDIVKENLQAISTGKPEFCFVYLPKLDAVMHEFGPESWQTAMKLEWLETQVQKIYSYAQRIYHKVNLSVFSDHGMAPVSRAVDIQALVEKTNLKYGVDYLAFYDSTMVRFWFLTQDSRNIMEQILNSIPEGRILPEEELKQMHVHFPHNKFGEMFFLMQEGILINPSFMGNKVIKGMHGYHPRDAHSSAVLLSNQVLPGSINSIIHIRRIMEMELATGK